MNKKNHKLTEAVDHAREYQGCKVAVPQLQILNKFISSINLGFSVIY
jgi:hypothetical protein